MFLGACIAGAAVTAIFKTSKKSAEGQIFIISMGVAGSIIDIFYRLKFSTGSLLSPDAGGSVFWIAIWIWGCGAILLGFFSGSKDDKDRTLNAPEK